MSSHSPPKWRPHEIKLDWKSWKTKPLVTFLFGGLFLDGLVGVDPPGDALLVRVLEAEVVCLYDIQLAEDDL